MTKRGRVLGARLCPWATLLICGWTFSCAESKAPGTAPATELGSIDLIGAAQDADRAPSGPGAVRFGDFRVGAERERGLMVGASQRYTFPPVEVSAGSELRFDYAVVEMSGVESQGEEGTLLRVGARCTSAAAPGCSEIGEWILFEQRVDDAAGVKAWRHASILVPPELAGAAEFFLEVPEAGGGSGVWGDLVVLPPEQELARGVPNVVLISLDTLRADHLSIYGYERETAPFLAELARGMTVFDNAYTTSTWTLPSHASLFTGLYPSQHGAVAVEGKLAGHPLSPEIDTLAEILERRGYLTLGVAAGPMLRREFGVDQGFAYYSDLWTDGRRYAGQVTELAKRWLERRGSRPFFLFLNYFDAHTPVDPPDYGDADHPVFEPLKIDVTSFNWRFMRENGIAELPPDVKAAMLARYDAEIAYLDRALAELFGYLEKQGLLENTIVAIVADHGESYGEQGLWGHGGAFYDEQARVPFLYGSPARAGRHERIAEPISIVELPGMILGDLGIREPRTEARRPVYGERYSPAGSNRMLVEGPFKYMVSLRPDGSELKRRERLFDLLADPAEDENLASPASPELQELRSRFLELVDGEGLAAESRVAARESEARTAEDEGGRLHEQLKALGYVE